MPQLTEQQIDKIPNMGKAAKVRLKQDVKAANKAVKDVSDILDGKEPEADQTKEVGGVAGSRLKSFIERIERLEEEKKGLGDDIKDVYAEAKGVGFDDPTIRKIIKERKVEPQKLNEQYELLDLYKSAIGMK